MFETVVCNICGSSDPQVVYPAGVAQQNQIVRCGDCGLMYASPRPAQAAHDALAARSEAELAEIERGYMVQRVEKETLQVKDYKDTRRLLKELSPQRGALLEIGSGFGFLLAAFRDDGWTVRGVDPDAQASSYARRENHVETTTGTLEDANIAPGSVDVVIMNHVIEHVPDPVGLMKEIHRILKPTGHFVMETPIYDSLTYRLLGPRERSLRCNGHIYFFTTDTLEKSFRLAGFEPVRARRVGRSLTLNRLAYNVGVISNSQAVKQSLEGLTRALGLNKVSFSLNLRDMERVCLRKAEPMVA